MIPEEYKKHKNLMFVKLKRPRVKSIINLLFIIASFRILKIQNTHTFKEKLNSETRGSFKFKSNILTFPFPKSTLIFNIFKSIILYLGSKNKEAIQLFNNYNPDLYISTLGQRSNECQYLALAYKRKINTISVISSWDVITTKGTFVLPCNHYFVWNKFNKEELENYVLKKFNISASIHVVGAPHFDIYNICASKGEVNNSSVETILYTTSPKYIFPNEIKLLFYLAEIFNNVIKDKKLLIRVHPQAIEDFSDLRKINYPNVEIYFPSEKSSNTEDKAAFGTNFFSDLHSQILESSKVINTASTITLDSAACNKRIANIGFDNLELPYLNTYFRSVKRFFQREHYKPIVESNLVQIINTPTDLVEFIQSDRESEFDQMKFNQKRDLFLPYLGKSGDHFIKKIDEIINE
jgi:hypothetical protein